MREEEETVKGRARFGREQKNPVQQRGSDDRKQK